MAESFWFGVAVGIGLLVVFGSISFLIGSWFAKISAAEQRQIVTHTTKRTPEEIVEEANRAKLILYLFLVFVGYGVCFLIVEYDPVLAEILQERWIALLLRVIGWSISVLETLQGSLEQMQGVY